MSRLDKAGVDIIETARAAYVAKNRMERQKRIPNEVDYDEQNFSNEKWELVKK